MRRDAARSLQSERERFLQLIAIEALEVLARYKIEWERYIGRGLVDAVEEFGGVWFRFLDAGYPNCVVEAKNPLVAVGLVIFGATSVQRPSQTRIPESFP